MTLDELERLVRSGKEPLLTIRQVSEMTDTPYSTVRAWVYRYRIIPTEPVGPTFRPRVRGSLIVKLFCQADSVSPGDCIPL